MNIFSQPLLCPDVCSRPGFQVTKHSATCFVCARKTVKSLHISFSLFHKILSVHIPAEQGEMCRQNSSKVLVSIRYLDKKKNAERSQLRLNLHSFCSSNIKFLDKASWHKYPVALSLHRLKMSVITLQSHRLLAEYSNEHSDNYLLQ